MFTRPNANTMPQSLVTARVAACLLGSAFLIWGIAPTVIGYALRADTWQLHKLSASITPLALGVAFITLAGLSTPRRSWPLRLTLALALTLATLNAIALFGADTFHRSVFPLLLTGCTAGATWIALDARRRAAARTIA